MAYIDCKKRDCYWYEEDIDMGARIPFCMLSKSSQPLEDCTNCTEYHSKYKRTNADHIRSMNDYDLAEWLCKILTYCSNKGINECSSDCPLYKCCNDQPTDNIEGWLKCPLEGK